MAEGFVSTLGMPPSAWLPAGAENEAYENIRRGEEAALRAVAQPLQPVLRRLIGVIAPSSPDAGAIIAGSWGVALRSLPMFRWHTPFATWVAAITVAHARTHVPRDSGTAALRALPAPPPPAPGPADWSDLPWSARWEHAPSRLAATLAALPLAEREVVHTRDVERWPPRRGCDVLGLPEGDYEALLAAGRAQLRDALATLVGESGGAEQRAAQTAAVVRMLGRPVADREAEPLDPGVTAVFRRWRAGQVTGWRRLSPHLLHPRARLG